MADHSCTSISHRQRSTLVITGDKRFGPLSLLIALGLVLGAVWLMSAAPTRTAGLARIVQSDTIVVTTTIQAAVNTAESGDTITPAAGANGSIAPNTPVSYTFRNVTASHTLSAEFALNSYTLAVGVIGHGTVTRVPSQTAYLHGSVVTLTAVPHANWLFAGWSGGPIGMMSQITLTLNANKTVTATFANAIADLQMSQYVVRTKGFPNGAITFTIAITNAGPGNASGANLVSAVQGFTITSHWVCTGASGGAICPGGRLHKAAAPDIAATAPFTLTLFSFPAGGVLTFELTGTAAPGPASSTVMLIPPAGYVDPDPTNSTVTTTTGSRVMLPVVRRM